LTNSEIRRRIIEIGIVPVVRADSARDARLAVDAVCAGGIPIVEITLTVPGAVDVIEDLAKNMASDVLVGAGTVLDAEGAQRCLDAGAQFIVSPGCDPETVALVKRSGKLMMAGGLTPNEVINAWKTGSDFVKIFPCGSVGGAKYIKTLKGPLPHVAMVPTGGVNVETGADFIRAGAEALGVGGELVFADDLRSGKVDRIIAAARRYIEVVREARQTARMPGQEILHKRA
jgi:2-dehydro-3-deoxyphosphogluconate aldolase/(4S)-4-hydroxy-2-oxoglutarate aldolase